MADWEKDAPRIASFLEKEAKRVLLQIELSSVRSWSTIEKEEGKPAETTHGVTASASFTSWTHRRIDKFTILPDGLSLLDLPVSVSIRFMQPENVSLATKGAGFIEFVETFSTDDGLVDEPNQLQVTLLLPSSMDRFFRGSLPLQLALRLDGVKWVPGFRSSEYEWNRKETHHFPIVSCHVTEQLEENAPVRAEAAQDDGAKANRMTIQNHLAKIVEQTKRIEVGVGILILILVLQKWFS